MCLCVCKHEYECRQIIPTLLTNTHIHIYSYAIIGGINLIFCIAFVEIFELLMPHGMERTSLHFIGVQKKFWCNDLGVDISVWPIIEIYENQCFDRIDWQRIFIYRINSSEKRSEIEQFYCIKFAFQSKVIKWKKNQRFIGWTPVTWISVHAC